MKKRFLWGAVAGGAFLLAVSVLYAAELGRIRLEVILSDFFRAPVHIHQLTFSPKRLTLHGVQIESGKHPFLVIEQLQIEGFWWHAGGVESVRVTRFSALAGGFPLKAQGRLFLTKVPHSAVRCDGWLQFDHPLVEGRIELSGTVLEPVILGWLEGENGSKRHFVSQWSLKRDAIRCLQMEVEGGWFFNGSLGRQPAKLRGDSPFFSGSFELNGPETGYRLTFDAISSAGGKALLEMTRREQAAREFSAEWMVRRGTIDFSAILFGGQARLRGQVEAEAPYPVHMELQLSGVAVSEAASWLLPPDRMPALSGRLRGNVKLEGPLSHIYSEGELSAKSFSMGQADFDSGVIRFKGEGPIFQLQNSQLMRPAGVLLMDGRVDLRRLGHADFFSSVRLSSLEKSISWDGWSMTQDPQFSGLQLSRPAADGKVSVGLNYQLDTAVQSKPIQRQGVEVGVPLSEQQKVSIRLNDDEEFLGVEHRKKF